MKFMVALDSGSDMFWVPCEGIAYALLWTGAKWFIPRCCCSNGLFGLGMEKISVPSILSGKALLQFDDLNFYLGCFIELFVRSFLFCVCVRIVCACVVVY
ncbi:putative aspartic peptidase A1 family [Rosa chinensis]|uniref:Putative aspartic peptidase A1 family n=1 Tax=Rosa chinensis TaxID=74649 RepID=A0A2P6QTZ5_ROSCH|nr:putative aspartic peptidase A1 family [Rosa chinensis]